MIWKQTFVVQGDGAFPIDMLRHDRCYPDGETDSILIAETFGRSETHMIMLVHLGPNKKWEPTVERWRSFGWTVDEHSLVAEKWG